MRDLARSAMPKTLAIVLSAVTLATIAEARLAHALGHDEVGG